SEASLRFAPVGLLRASGGEGASPPSIPTILHRSRASASTSCREQPPSVHTERAGSRRPKRSLHVVAEREEELGLLRAVHVLAQRDVEADLLIDVTDGRRDLVELAALIAAEAEAKR